MKIPSTPLAVGSASWSHSSAHAIHSSTPRPSISAADPVSIDRNAARKSRTAAGSCQSCASSLNFRHRLASRLRRCCSSYRRLSASWRSRSLPLDPCVVERAMVRQRRKWPECQAACPPLVAFGFKPLGGRKQGIQNPMLATVRFGEFIRTEQIAYPWIAFVAGLPFLFLILSEP